MIATAGTERIEDEPDNSVSSPYLDNLEDPGIHPLDRIDLLFSFYHLHLHLHGPAVADYLQRTRTRRERRYERVKEEVVPVQL